jgi:hypothetical protein
MERFLSRHGSKVIGVLSGFDRLIFRGTLRQLSHVSGLQAYLAYSRILLKEFATRWRALTERVRRASEAVAEKQGRPVRYVNSSNLCKEDIALEMLRDSPIDEGLIGVISCVESCQTFEIHRSRERKRLELAPRIRKCLHLYHYLLDPEFGLMHVRLQTWIPFTVQICVNGRHWLARQLARAGIGCTQRDNCFSAIDDFKRAQRTMDRLLRSNWPRLLDRIAFQVNPAHKEIFADAIMPYYWSVHQAEWATDLAFDTTASLARIYRPLVLHAITQFSSPDVMRFLGQKVSGRFEGEIVSGFKNRPEGIRVKHQVQKNSIKVYDKQGSVLRVETTINHPRDLKVYRRPEGQPDAKLAWLPMRKGIADLHRLAELSQDSNERYLNALAVVEDPTALRSLLQDICQPIVRDGQRHRALRPWDPTEVKVLEAINRGEFVINGFRNRDLRALLYPKAGSCPRELSSTSAKTGRLLRLLRAHSLIKKIPKTHRYQVTERGRRTITAIIAAQNASVSKLIQAA